MYKKIWSYIKKEHLAIFASIVAALSLAWTILQEFEKGRERLEFYSYQQDEAETFQIQETNPVSDYVEVPYKFKILLANTGEKTISIVRFKGIPLSEEQYTGTGTQTKVGFTTEEGQVKRIPFIISSGESIVLNYNNKIKVHKKDFSTISKTYTKETGKFIVGQDINLYELFRLSVNSGVDIFGNKVTKRFENSAYFTFEVPHQDPIFELVFSSAQEHEFSYTLFPWPKNEDGKSIYLISKP
ncbi:hypothetical protein ABEW50_23695 [Paenibacillus jamilae]